LEGLIAKGVLIVDTRSRAEIAKGFIPGTLHIELNNSFNNWFAQLVSHDRQVAFIVAEGQKEQLTLKLMRVGFDNVLGVVDDISSVASKQIAYASAADLEVAVQHGSALVLDIRTDKEYEAGHINGVGKLTLTDIRTEAERLDKNKPLIIHCQSGARAAIGFSLFEQLGFKDIRVYDGGINEWKALGKELVSK
jgi:hydroxyacylglutathione hydrolase